MEEQTTRLIVRTVVLVAALSFGIAIADNKSGKGFTRKSTGTRRFIEVFALSFVTILAAFALIAYLGNFAYARLT